LLGFVFAAALSFLVTFAIRRACGLMYAGRGLN
jgi:hypothetical protein